MFIYSDILYFAVINSYLRNDIIRSILAIKILYFIKFRLFTIRKKKRILLCRTGTYILLNIEPIGTILSFLTIYLLLII